VASSDEIEEVDDGKSPLAESQRLDAPCYPLFLPATLNDGGASSGNQMGVGDRTGEIIAFFRVR
jgi:hypothetical protein